MNRFRQSQPLLFPDIKAKYACKGSRTAGMLGIYATVAGHHHPGLLIKGFHIALDHGLADDGRFGVRGVSFADQLDVHIGFGKAVGLGQFSEGVPGVGFVGRKFGYRNVRTAPVAFECCQHAFRIFILLVRDNDFEVGVPSVVGIAIGQKIHAAFAGRFDDFDVFRRFTLHANRSQLNMRVFHRDVGLFSDGNFFLQRFERFVGFIADVGHVDTAAGRGNFGQRNHLVRGRVTAHFVFEAAGKPECALGHLLAHLFLHQANFLRRRNTLEIFTHHLLANRGVAGERSHVYGCRMVLHLVEPGGHGDALRNLGLCRQILRQRLFGMVVNVDKSGSKNQSLCVDSWFAGFRCQFADSNDMPRGDANVCPKERRARAVRDLRVQNQQRLRRFLGAGGQKRQKAEEQLREEDP